MLLEQQWNYSGSTGYVPVEWYPITSPNPQSLTAVYAAITNAVGNGISVVEAGGNGGIDTDTMTWYGDSGAVIVGAGGAYAGGTYPNGDLQRLSFSSYGSRFDLHAWGENVLTTGYGDYYSTEGSNLYYTNTFSGTSSASPMVAGAIACMNGYYAANVSTTPMTPAVIRANLVATGTAQLNPYTGHIGPRPDLYAAIQALPQGPAYWTDVTSGPLGDTGAGKSMAWGDMDNDGDDDLYITNTQTSNRVLRNDAGGLFTDITTPVEANNMFAAGAEWGDYDNDGFLDIYNGNWGGINRLFQSMGPAGGFTEMTMMPIDDMQDGSGVAWIDFDNDGFLDIHVSNMNGGMDRLFQNTGMGIFMDATMPPIDNLLDSHDGAWSDFDNDGDMDCYIVNTNGPNELLVNMGGGGFMPLSDPVLLDTAVGWGASWGDADNDGDTDLYLVNQLSANRMFRNDGLFFTDVTSGPLGDVGYGHCASWADYDNDGDLDLYLTNQTGANKLLRNDGSFVFTDDTNGPLGDTGPGQGTAWADYDNDGDMDIYMVNAGTGNKLFRNDINNGNHWLQVQLQGTNSNAAAIGVKVKIVAGGQTQYRELGSASGYCAQNSFRLHFGLGTVTVVDSVIIDWPGFGQDIMLGLGADQMIVQVQSPMSGAGDLNSAHICRMLPSVPNPFNPRTMINFELSRAGSVNLKVYNVAGQCVRTLVSQNREAGLHSVSFNGKNDAGQTLPSGVYFGRLVAEGTVHTTKLVMTK
jgi:enediyne biosynthesis protein E4